MRFLAFEKLTDFALNAEVSKTHTSETEEDVIIIWIR